MCQAWAEYQGRIMNKTDNRAFPEEEDILRNETDIKQINKQMYYRMVIQEERLKDWG